jgi:nucleoredoxin
MMSNLETGWIYVPFENVQQRNDLKRHFGICAKKEMEDVGISEDHRKNGIPTLIIIDKQRDVVLTAQGIDDIMGSETTTKVDDPLSKWRHLLSLSNLED